MSIDHAEIQLFVRGWFNMLWWRIDFNKNDCALKLQLFSVGAHNSVGVAEQCHAPLQKHHSVLKSSYRTLRQQIVLWLAMKTVNGKFRGGKAGTIPFHFHSYSIYSGHDQSPTIKERTNGGYSVTMSWNRNQNSRRSSNIKIKWRFKLNQKKGGVVP